MPQGWEIGRHSVGIPSTPLCLRSRLWKGRLSFGVLKRSTVKSSSLGFQVIPSLCTHEKDSALGNGMRFPSPASILNSHLQVLEACLRDTRVQSQPSTQTLCRTHKNCLVIISSRTVSSATKLSFLLSVGKVLIFLADWKPNKYL